MRIFHYRLSPETFGYNLVLNVDVPTADSRGLQRRMRLKNKHACKEVSGMRRSWPTSRYYLGIRLYMYETLIRMAGNLAEVQTLNIGNQSLESNHYYTSRLLRYVTNILYLIRW